MVGVVWAQRMPIIRVLLGERVCWVGQVGVIFHVVGVVDGRFEAGAVCCHEHYLTIRSTYVRRIVRLPKFGVSPH